MKCPDCGARTVIPEPPKPMQKNMPAALEGEQYELWDADEQPLPSELIAAQQKYIAVTCRRCGSLLQAAENQIGHPIVCTDCGAAQIVPPAPRPVVKRSVLAANSHTPQIDPAADPGERPQTAPSARPMAFEVQQDAAFAAALEKSQRTGKPTEIDSRGRNRLPRFPLLTGIISFPFYAGCLERWMILSVALLLSYVLLAGGLRTWIVWTPKAYDYEGGMQAMAGLTETIFGLIAFILWWAATSNIMIAIVSQSAVGVKRISDWPMMNFISSLAEMLPVTIAIIFTMAPGWMLGDLLAGGWLLLGACALCTLLIGFPITLLSQLAGSSTWELVDLKVLGAAVRCPFSMLLFWMQSACLAAACIVPTILLVQINVYWPLVLAPAYMLCIFWYGRLLGRLAWRLSAKISVDEPADVDNSTPATKNYNPPRQKAAT